MHVFSYTARPSTARPRAVAVWVLLLEDVMHAIKEFRRELIDAMKEGTWKLQELSQGKEKAYKLVNIKLFKLGKR